MTNTSPCWKIHHVTCGDSNRNGVEALAWLLLRAMSKDSALHILLTGADNDADLAKYVNETSFVWCDAPGRSLKSNVKPWIENLEKKGSFMKILKDSYGVSDHGLVGCVEDLWFPVSRLNHSDTNRVQYLSRVAVMPPEGIGVDIVASWPHSSDPNEPPLLVLAACTERTAAEKLKAETSNTFPSTMGSRVDPKTKEEYKSEFSKLSLSSFNRRTLRILLHPNVIPGDNVEISNLANWYDLSEDVIRRGYGRDSHENFVALINRITLKRAIHEHGGKSNSRFGNMVLRLWERYFKEQEHYCNM